MTSQNRPGTPLGAFRTVLADTLKDDAVLYPHLGVDKWGNRKVYEILGPDGVEPPYIIWALLSPDSPEGQFGDLKSIEAINFQVGGWGYDRESAWQLAFMAEEALDLMHPEQPEMQPYTIMSILRVGLEINHDERVNWYQGTGTYRATVSR